MNKLLLGKVIALTPVVGLIFLGGSGTLSTLQEKKAVEVKEIKPPVETMKIDFVASEEPIIEDRYEPVLTQEQIDKENQYYLKKEKKEIEAEEKFKADPLNAPLDLTDSRWKDHQGLFYELDFGPVVFSFLNDDHLSVWLGPNLKCGSGNNESWADCLTFFEPLMHERVSAEGKKIISLVVPVTDFDGVPVTFVNGKALRMTTVNLPTRYHLIKKGDIKSQVFSRGYNELKITAMIYADYPDTPPVKLKDIDSFKKLLPADFNSKDDYFLMKGKYLKIVNSYDPKASEIDFYLDADLTGDPVLLKSHPVVIDESNSNGNYFKTFIKFKSYDLEKNIITVTDGSRDIYASLGLCRKLECSFVYYPQSSYENDLLEIELIKNRKKESEIMWLIDKIQPCLLSKDEKCIDSFFLQKNETPGEDESPCIDATVNLPVYTFSLKDFDELKACMRAESIMFHKLALKGNKKFCSLAPLHTLNQHTSNKLIAIGSFEIVKADYRNYVYGEYYRVPPKLRHEVEEMLYLRNK